MASQTHAKRIAVSVLGASGYSGQELLRRLLYHPGANLVHAFAQTAAGICVSDLIPSLKDRTELALETFSFDAVAQSEAVFVALPSGEALQVIPQLLELGLTVIDLGGDFRLRDISAYERYYGRRHPAPALLERAVYGLSEWNRKALAEATLIANPGCYPTSVLLPLLPLLKEHLIEGQNINVSSMSGVSGAGRSATLELSFAEVNESVRAYKLGVHQHQPEIQTYCRSFSGTHTTVNFVAHLLPITRGIYSTMFARLAKDVDVSTIASTFEHYYGNEPFVRLLNGTPPEIAQVRGTNRVDIGFALDAATDQVTVLSAIDNLVKGAAGQAIQNFNIRYGLNETEGLA